ncbi:MAG TPA: hypothetical protein VIU38_14180 [Anaerolineales bacterium]
MYWFFSAPGWGLVLWLACLLLILVGGWLIATHAFALEPRERVLCGLAIGLVCYLTVSNWIGRVLPPFGTFLAAAIIVLLLGILAAYPFRKPWLDLNDLRIGGWLVAGLALLWVFLRISKGTGLFDEYKNLAIISTMANGQIPAMAYFGQPTLLRYHYGFHLLGASMMQMAHLAPWSAFDLSKAMVWSLSLLLAGLVGARYLRLRLGTVVMAAAVGLAGGTRYLMLLLPSGILRMLEQHVTLRGIASGGLAQALASVLPMEASPNIGYPFAFLSGIDPSYVMAHGGEQTIEPMLLMLGLLLMERPAKRASAFFFAILFSFWALASETSFVLIAAAWSIWMLIRWFGRGRSAAAFRPLELPTLGLLMAVPLILLQGGTITAMAQQLVAGVPSIGPPGVQAQPNLVGFSGRWPPAILSGQMGVLPLTDPWATVAGILEMGIVVLMLPWMTVRWWQRERDVWRTQLLLATSWLGVLIPLFLAWSSDANISHITDFGIDVTVVALVLMLAGGPEPDAALGHRRFAVTGWLALLLMCVPGLVLLAIQLTAAQDTILSEHYGDAEARLLQQAWGRLPRASKMLGSMGPGSILAGQLTGGIYSLPRGQERAIWEQMLVSPRLATLVEDHFDFVFVNARWWNELDARSQQELQDPCIRVFARGEAFPGGNYAEILDLRGCR